MDRRNQINDSEIRPQCNEISKWRPITLRTDIYKIVAKTIAIECDRCSLRLYMIHNQDSFKTEESLTISLFWGNDCIGSTSQTIPCYTYVQTLRRNLTSSRFLLGIIRAWDVIQIFLHKQMLDTWDGLMNQPLLANSLT